MSQDFHGPGAREVLTHFCILLVTAINYCGPSAEGKSQWLILVTCGLVSVTRTCQQISSNVIFASQDGMDDQYFTCVHWVPVFYQTSSAKMIFCGNVALVYYKMFLIPMPENKSVQKLRIS